METAGPSHLEGTMCVFLCIENISKQMNSQPFSERGHFSAMLGRSVFSTCKIYKCAYPPCRPSIFCLELHIIYCNVILDAHMAHNMPICSQVAPGCQVSISVV